MFHQEGVSVSTARIAETAGVSNGTLFNYFPTKQALIDALYVSIKSDLAAAVGTLDDGMPVELRMRQVWDRWFGWARGHRNAHHVMNLLHQAGLASASAQAEGISAIQVPAKVLADAVSAGILVDLPIEYLAALIQHQLDQAVMSELDDEQAEVAFGVLWNGITHSPTQSPNQATR